MLPWLTGRGAGLVGSPMAFGQHGTDAPGDAVLGLVLPSLPSSSVGLSLDNTYTGIPQASSDIYILKPD